MHTKDALADALLGIGLMEMSRKAREGYYHDFLSPLDSPQLMLLGELTVAAKNAPDREQAIFDLRNRVISGEFDASAEESDDWATSPDGQAAFASLLRR